jgi:NAD(P)-dependent dehydrogenase (short-subunit alcohol dehydrogenase family)
MANIFITGSADGLGHLAAKLLVSQRHHVVLHARSAARGKEALAKLPGADKVLTADLSSLEETKRLAADVNAVGEFDAVIHNAGVYTLPARQDASDFQQAMININTLAPYILTCLIRKPKRLIYLSSGSHMGGDPSLKILNSPPKSVRISQTYSDTKLHDVILATAVARKWPEVYSNALDPGWVPTKMADPVRLRFGKRFPDTDLALVSATMNRQRLAVVIFIIRNKNVLCLQPAIWMCRKNFYRCANSSPAFISRLIDV